MGEIADMMIEGDLCAGCGVYMDDEAEGFPRYCSASCDPDSRASGASSKTLRNRRKRKNRLRNRALRLEETKKAGLLKGWKQCGEYHFQKRFGLILVNWWPSSRKIHVNGETFNCIDTQQEIEQIVNALPKKEKPNETAN